MSDDDLDALGSAMDLDVDDYDGPNIRPPQHHGGGRGPGGRGHRGDGHASSSSSRSHGSSRRDDHRERDHHRSSSGKTSASRHGGGRERDHGAAVGVAGGGRDHRDRNHDRNRPRGGGDRHGRPGPSGGGGGGGDLRDRINSRGGGSGKSSSSDNRGRRPRSRSRDRDQPRHASSSSSTKHGSGAGSGSGSGSASNVPAHHRLSDDEKRVKEERLKRLMQAQANMERSRRDMEVKRKQQQEEEDNAAQQQQQKQEPEVRRKRDRSNEGSRRKKKSRKDESPVAEAATEAQNEVEDDDEEEEDDEAESGTGEEDSGSDEESGSEDDEEDSSEEEDSSQEEDTASEHSGATPEPVASAEEGEEEEVEEEEEVSAPVKPAKHKKKHRHRHRRSRSRSRSRTHSPDHIEGKWGEPKKGRGSRRGREGGANSSEAESQEEEEEATPTRSPTPRRGQEDEDEEDNRLEAALRGELKNEAAGDQEGTPKSQGSFGDAAGSSEQPQDDASRTGENNAAAAASSTAAEDAEKEKEKVKEKELPPYLPSVYGCRSVEEFHCLNRIEEGTYGVVYRARDKKTKEIVALKRLKMEREKEGFPITSLREINTLLISQHPNVVTVREIVVGSNMDKIYIVMDFVEHDLKGLMETMREKKQVFLPGEIKCLMDQLLRAIGHLHDNWILHRDLKSSNLLLSHNGVLKVGDFGLAREYGSPLKPYTPVVVTLWYRAPELLLGQKEYSTHIDVWSVGCVFGELLQMEPLFCGRSDNDQLNKIFKLLGTPSEKIWPGYNQLPAVKHEVKFVDYPISHLRTKFPNKMLSDAGLNLLKRFLTYDPKKRLTCDEALGHDYFQEMPRAVDPSMFPTWPAKSELSAADRANKKKEASPKPPSGGGAYKQINEDELEAKAAEGFSFVDRNKTSVLPQWNLKF